MTRRIALAILLSACAMLMAGGIAAYISVWETLVVELDQTLIERATALMRLTQKDDQPGEPPVPDGDRYIIRSERGHTLVRPSPDPAPSDAPTVLSRAFVAAAGGTRVRTLTLRWDDAPEPVTIIYSTPAARFDSTMKRLAITLTMVLIAGIAVTAGVARWVSRIATRPLQQTAQTIGRIDEQHLDRRIDAGTLPSELVPVATRLNEMLERLERALRERQQFMLDAAHELRSPVAALRTTLEVALQPPRDPQSFLLTLEKCLSSTRMLDRLVDVLTQQLRGGGKPRRQELQVTDISRLIQDCVDLVAPLAQTRQIVVTRLAPETMTLTCEPDGLRSIVTNLLTNAVAYTDGPGEVTVVAVRENNRLRLTVRDTGVGIAAEHLPHIFEPFYRADAARANNGEHLGLGLYLVKSHVQSMGGTCEVQSTPAVGTSITVVLPVSDAPAVSRDDEQAGKPVPLGAPAAVSCSSHD